MLDLPEPPVPANADLTVFKNMPLEISRLRRSKAWLICKRHPELAFYMINLWTAAWHSVPAGSLEDDDDVLADHAMCDPVRWDELKPKIMRGWYKCSDGQLYHPVVAEKVLEAWSERLEFFWKKECDRIRKENKSREKIGGIPLEFPEKPAEFRRKNATFHGIPAENALKGREGKGRDISIEARSSGIGDNFSAHASAPASAQVPAPDAGLTLAEKGKQIMASDPILAASKAIIGSFDDIGRDVWGAENFRPYPAANDLTTARRWLEAGADLALCQAVFETQHDRMKRAKTKRPAGSLNFFDADVRQAIAELRASAPDAAGAAPKSSYVRPPEADGLHGEDYSMCTNLIAYRDMGLWLYDWGEKPGDKLCRIKPTIIARVFGDDWREKFRGGYDPEQRVNGAHP